MTERDDEDQTPLTDAETMARLLRHIETAGDGDRRRGLQVFRSMMIERRNRTIFYRFAVWGGGALMSAALFGKQLVDTVSWVLSVKFGGK